MVPTERFGAAKTPRKGCHLSGVEIGCHLPPGSICARWVQVRGYLRARNGMPQVAPYGPVYGGSGLAAARPPTGSSQCSMGRRGLSGRESSPAVSDPYQRRTAGSCFATQHRRGCLARRSPCTDRGSCSCIVGACCANSRTSLSGKDTSSLPGEFGMPRQPRTSYRKRTSPSISSKPSSGHRPCIFQTE